MKKLVSSLSVGALLFASIALPTFASNSGDGSDYGTQPGFFIANDNTICAGHGSFDAFGKGANLGIEVSLGNGDVQHATFLGSWPGPGTDGTQTGLNNSGLCGNRQGNL